MSAPTLWFLVLTFGISAIAGLGAFAIGGAKTFESPKALPLLLLTIWSPNVAAVVVTVAAGDSVGDLLAPLVDGAPPGAWLAALSPLGVAAVIGVRLGGIPPLSPRILVALIGTNLVMGPLGEEVGWRGYLLPRAVDDHGLVVAGLIVGVVWAVWHWPLWFLPSPHREIPFLIFAATVVCFSMIMTAIWSAGDGALGPIVMFHLAANVGVGWLEVGERTNGPTAYRRGLPLYAALAVAATLWLAESS